MARTEHISRMVCPNCRKARYYHEKYDAYACLWCNTWLEEKCSDKECEFCIDRPEKPE